MNFWVGQEPKRTSFRTSFERRSLILAFRPMALAYNEAIGIKLSLGTCAASERHSSNPRVAGCNFGSSYDIRQLQAADLFAWEVYQHATEIFLAGKIQSPKREALRLLNENMKMTTQLATREAIQQIADYIGSQPPDYVKAAANHFTNFDPARPDYSYLAGNSPKP
jgi:hypothetical protein